MSSIIGNIIASNLLSWLFLMIFSVSTGADHFLHHNSFICIIYDSFIHVSVMISQRNLVVILASYVPTLTKKLHMVTPLVRSLGGLTQSPTPFDPSMRRWLAICSLFR